MAKKGLIIVESPTKARTIAKFLPDHDIIASYGHVRDLPGSAADVPAAYKKKSPVVGIDVENNFKPIYIINKDKEKTIKQLQQKVAKADKIYLATDEDREGESISWHILEVLKTKKTVKRMVFNEITKSAIANALINTRDIDMNLVKAQETRRILDRLVGYTVSPVLWQKVAPKLSAGRVQSALLKIIVARELERIDFVSSDYCDLLVDFNKDGKDFSAKIKQYDGKEVAQGKDFNPKDGKLLDPQKKVVLTKQECKKLEDLLKNSKFNVAEVDKKSVTRKSSSPFITSSLQQEAIRRFNISAKQTMSIAQSLYEKGFITYMRTDSTNLSTQALNFTKNYIIKEFGTKYFEQNTKAVKKTTVKNAQEAHEAIRPAGSNFKHPAKSGLEGLEKNVYQMIWQRTIASQMSKAVFNRVAVKLEAKGHVFQANGQTLEFDGFLKVYDTKSSKNSEDEKTLPELKPKDVLIAKQLTTVEHKTVPKARYTEASLVQTMENEGIGRPSTYVSVIETLINRGYIKKHRDTVFPTVIAFAVNNLLNAYLPDLVDVNFTAKMEQALDSIAKGKIVGTEYLHTFYDGNKGLKSKVDGMLEKGKIPPTEFRAVKLAKIGHEIIIGRYGPFIKTEKNNESFVVKVPTDTPPADLDVSLLEAQIKNNDQPAIIAKDPKTNLDIHYMVGPYGPYLQLGQVSDINKKPKRFSLPANYEQSAIDEDLALKIISLPKTIGEDENGVIKAGMGPYGPYVLREHLGQKTYRSLTDFNQIFELNLTEANEILSKAKKFSKSPPIKDLGAHPKDEKPILVFKGRYGNYIKWGKLNVSIPKNLNLADLDQKKALELIKTKLSKAKK